MSRSSSSSPSTSSTPLSPTPTSPLSISPSTPSTLSTPSPQSPPPLPPLPSTLFVDYGKKAINMCLQKFMSLEETMTYLQDNYQITPEVTKACWDLIDLEDPDFFRIYDGRRQKKLFRDEVMQKLQLPKETSEPSPIVDHVKNKIELCLQKSMGLEETMAYLEDNHEISPDLTKEIWEKLEKQNPEYFRSCYDRRQNKILFMAEVMQKLQLHKESTESVPEAEVPNNPNPDNAEVMEQHHEQLQKEIPKSVPESEAPNNPNPDNGEVMQHRPEELELRANSGNGTLASAPNQSHLRVREANSGNGTAAQNKSPLRRSRSL